MTVVSTTSVVPPTAAPVSAVAKRAFPSLELRTAGLAEVGTYPGSFGGGAALAADLAVFHWLALGVGGTWVTDLSGAVQSGGGRVGLESLRDAWAALHSELETTDPLRSAAGLMVDAIAGAAAAVTRTVETGPTGPTGPTGDAGDPNPRATDAAVGGPA